MFSFVQDFISKKETRVDIPAARQGVDWLYPVYYHTRRTHREQQLIDCIQYITTHDVHT